MGYLSELKKKLSPETFAKLEEELGDDIDDDYVPRSRLNTVIKQRNELKALIPQDNGTNDLDVKGDNKPTTAKTQADIDKAVADALASHAKEVADVKLQFAGLDKLREVKAYDPELVYSLIDKTKIEADGKGLDEQIAEIAKAKPFLFDGGVVGTGKQSISGEEAKVSATDAKLNAVFGAVGVFPAGAGTETK